MTPSNNPAAMSMPPDSDPSSSGPIVAAASAQARRLRRFELVCWSLAGLLTIAWALSLWFRFGFQMPTGGMDVYDSQLRFAVDARPNTPSPASGVFAGRLDRAGDLPWLERLGLTLPHLDHNSTPGRFDAMAVDLPMWLVVGFYTALAARIRRRRLHPEWQPRGTRFRAALWTIATLAVAILAMFAALGELTASGARHYAAARMNRFAFVWSEHDPDKKHRIPDFNQNLTPSERWAIEPPVFAVRTDWNNKPELIACTPSWMLFVPCLFMTVHAWRRITPLPPNLCKRCRYDLTGNTSGKCSECGRIIDWDIHGTRQ